MTSPICSVCHDHIFIVQDNAPLSISTKKEQPKKREKRMKWEVEGDHKFAHVLLVKGCEELLLDIEPRESMTCYEL